MKLKNLLYNVLDKQEVNYSGIIYGYFPVVLNVTDSLIHFQHDSKTLFTITIENIKNVNLTYADEKLLYTKLTICRLGKETEFTLTHTKP